MEVPLKRKPSHLRLPRKDVKTVRSGYAIEGINFILPEVRTNILFEIHGYLRVGSVSPITKKFAVIVSLRNQ